MLGRLKLTSTRSALPEAPLPPHEAADTAKPRATSVCKVRGNRFCIGLPFFRRIFDEPSGGRSIGVASLRFSSLTFMLLPFGLLRFAAG